MKKELVCIACPVGCRLTVTVEGDTVSVTGNDCARGVTYGKTETLNPTRMVTSSIPIMGGDEPLVSVRTAVPVPKGKVPEVLKAIRGMSAVSPVTVGQTLTEDIGGTGVALIVTRAG